MYEYKVILVYEFDLEEEINKMAKEGWELHTSIINDFEYDRTDEYSPNIRVERYNLVFRRQK